MATKESFEEERSHPVALEQQLATTRAARGSTKIWMR
jgi:hypothetical protein